MKVKILFLLIVFILCANISFAQTKVVYRVSSGEVVRITTGSTYNEENRFGFALVVNPIFDDGQVWLDPNYDYRVFGYAKIYVSGSNTVRNATQAEISGFLSAAEDDEKQNFADLAENHIQNDPQFRRIMKALSAIIANEFNDRKALHDAILDAAANAADFADFKNRMGQVGTAPTRSKLSLFNAIKNKVDKDD